MTLLTPLRRCDDAATFMGRLEEVAKAAIDVVAPQRALQLTHGHVEGKFLWGLPEFPDLTLTYGALGDLSDRLDIPMRYWQRILEKHTPLASLTHNILAQADKRRALYRLLQTPEEGWILRAVLSDSYGIFDNFTVLQAVSGGLSKAGHDLADAKVQVDLTADRLRMRIMLPQIELAVPELLAGYRSPFSLRPGAPVHEHARGDEGVPPVLWAGVELTNSETGKGAFSIAPRAEFLICRNGLTRTSDIIRQVHLGGKMEEGRVQWSDDTRRLNVELLASKVVDAVTQFASVEYLMGLRADMEEASVTEAGTAEIEAVSAAHKLTEDETRSVMDAFLRSGQPTRLGVAQAISAVAQGVEDGDRQAELEAMFLPVCAGVG